MKAIPGVKTAESVVHIMLKVSPLPMLSKVNSQ